MIDPGLIASQQWNMMPNMTFPWFPKLFPHYSSHHIPSLPALCRMLQRRHQRPLRVLHRGTRVGDCKQWKEKQLFMIHHLSIFHPFIHLSSHHLSIFSVKIHLWLDLLHGYPWISAVLHGNLLHHRLHGPGSMVPATNWKKSTDGDFFGILNVTKCQSFSDFYDFYSTFMTFKKCSIICFSALQVMSASQTSHRPASSDHYS